METILAIFSADFWWIAAILVTLTTTITGTINQGLRINKTWLKQLISWIVSAGLSVGTWAMEITVFADPIWLSIVCLTIVIGLASNGLYDIPTIKNFISTWFTKKSE